MSNNIFIDLTEEMVNKGWTIHWEFNKAIDLYKYNNCTTVAECEAIDADSSYKTDLDANGAWLYHLGSLTNGGGMFLQTFITSFSGDLSSLENGDQMFRYTALQSFNGDLPSLTAAFMMFDNCPLLESFNGNLSSLTNGMGMFSYCPAFESFNGNLSSLTNGMSMFYDCKLNTTSVQNIVETINDLTGKTSDGTWGWGKINIGISNSTPNAEEETAFNTMVSRGWTVYVNGTSSSDIWTPTASTNLTNEEQSISIPFYAKPIQVTEEHADYTSFDGKFYSIVGAQFIYGDDLSTYGMFTSFEHAESEIMLSLNLTKIEKTNLSNLIKLN